MALRSNENKVKFGLKRVAFAIATIAPDGSATYGKPITFPGARALSMEPQGTGEAWYSDDGVYYYNTAPSARQGDLEMARMIDSFKEHVLKYVQDTNGLLLEDMNPETVHFALLFETMNDRKPRRYVMYNCVATAPAVGSTTNEGSKEPQTETTSISSMGIYVASHNKWVDHAESTPQTNSESYANWFNEVQLPAPPADPYFTETISGTVVYIDDTVELPLKNLTVYGKSTQTGTPSPSSPAAISTAGSDGNIDIVRVGKNLLNVVDFAKDSGSAIDSTDAESGTITVTANGGTYGGASNKSITLIQGVTYVFSGNISGVNGGTSRVAVRNASNNIKASTTSGATGPFSFTFTPTEPGWYVTLFASLGTAVQGSVTYSNLQIEAAATATTFAPYVSAITSILPTPNGLAGIKVSSGGNYTDARGQKWLCDTIDKVAGKYIKRCETIASYNGETIPGAYMSSTGDLSTGATVVYALAAPVTANLTAAQTVALNALSGLDGGTTVYVDDAVPADIRVEAYVEDH